MLGQESAAAFTRILFEVFHGVTLERAVASVHLSRSIMEALEAARTADPHGPPETVDRLGGGLVAEEALAIAIYAARVGRDVEHGLRIAVTHGGDSDSTGAVAGNLLGLLHPAGTLAHPWRSEIECADLIARDLAAAREPGDGFAEDYRDRYPGF